MFPKRGEIWVVELDPVKGSEIAKTRPCFVISEDRANYYLNTVTIIPISSGEPQNSSFHIHLSQKAGLKEDSHMILHQIRTVSKKRFTNLIGKAEKIIFEELELKLNKYLGF